MGRENPIYYILFCIENISSDMFICYITCFRTFQRKWLPSGGGIDVLHNLFRKFSRAFRDTEILLHRNSKLRGFQSGLEMWMSTTERVYARHHARRMNVLDSIPGGGWGKKVLGLVWKLTKPEWGTLLLYWAPSYFRTFMAMRLMSILLSFTSGSM